MIAWVWFLVLLVAPVKIEGPGSDLECSGPLIASLTDTGQRGVCGDAQRGWPEVVGLLGLANVLSLVTVALFLDVAVQKRTARAAGTGDSQTEG